jgi:hypothetical protein
VLVVGGEDTPRSGVAIFFRLHAREMGMQWHSKVLITCFLDLRTLVSDKLRETIRF